METLHQVILGLLSFIGGITLGLVIFVAIFVWAVLCGALFSSTIRTLWTDEEGK